MGVLVGLVVLVVAVLLGAGLLSLATGLAGVEGRSFGKALTATVAAGIVGFLVGLPLGLLGLGDGLIGSAVGLVTYLGVIRVVYDTSWGKAFLAWILEVVVILVLMVPFMALGGIAALLG